MRYNSAPVCTCEGMTDICSKKIDTPLSYNLEFINYVLVILYANI